MAVDLDPLGDYRPDHHIESETIPAAVSTPIRISLHLPRSCFTLGRRRRFQAAAAFPVDALGKGRVRVARKSCHCGAGVTFGPWSGTSDPGRSRVLGNSLLTRSLTDGRMSAMTRHVGACTGESAPRFDETYWDHNA